ncbi:MAG: tetratricopeptide repeat protein [Anaerolineae bacterium]|nr:tetratricopeptide repeat protein [Anaerolineae bacterium]
MADVSLREYLAKLAGWMHDGSADQVIWHARHILQYYPKNVDAYRYIGQALASLGRLEEASAVLRRALSVIPDDGKTHAILSSIYERLDRSNEAIWHMERAYEQDTNATDVIDNLQRLYREFRNVSHPRLHLTTAAAARQSMRSGAYDRAVDSLRGALNRAPQRADLQILLAQALWQRGDFIDAAEVAMDVLNTYPDCLVANQLLAELWLREERPSDAQRYLNRLESIDPYLALSLIQPGKADPNLFHLPELDFDKSTQSAMVGGKLDWLEGIEAGDVPSEAVANEYAATIEDWLEPESEAAPPVTPLLEVSSIDEADNWLSELDNIEQNYKVTTDEFQTTTSPLSDDNDLPQPDMETLAGEQEDADLSIEWMGDSLGEPISGSEDDPFSWLLTSENELDEGAPATIDTEDPLAWMRQADMKLPDTTELTPEMLQEAAEEDDDSMGWLSEYSTDMISNWQDTAAENPPVATNQPIEPAPDALTFEEDEEFLFGELPFAQTDADYAAELIEEAQPDAAPPDDMVPANTPIETVEDDWSLNETLLEETFGLEALTDDATGWRPELASTSAPPEWTPEGEPAEGFAETLQGTERGNTMSDAATPDFDWLDDDSESSGEATPTGATGMLDWLSRSEAASSEDVEAMADTSDVDAFQPEDGSTGMTDMLDWMEGAEAEPDESPDVETPEDMSTGSTGMLNWLSQNRPLPATMPLQPQDIAEQAQASSADDAEEWLADLSDNVPDAAEEIAAEGASMLDWLGTDAIPAAESSEPVPAAGELENADAWLADLMGHDEAASEDEADRSIEWSPEAQVQEDAAVADDLSWLTSEAQPEAEPTLDDLTMIEGIEPETAETLQMFGITTFQALAAANEDELLAALQAGGLNISSVTNWLTQAHFLAAGDIQGFYSFQDSLSVGIEEPVGDATGIPALSPSDMPEIDWMGEDAALETGEEVAEEPFWLDAAMSLEDDEKAEQVPQPEEVPWPSEDIPVETGEEIPDAPSWLDTTMSLEDDENAELAPEPEDVPWPSEDIPAETGEEVAEEPSWLDAAMSLENDENPEQVPEPEAEIDWFGADDLDEEAEEVSSEPDWLTANAAFEEAMDVGETEEPFTSMEEPLPASETWATAEEDVSAFAEGIGEAQAEAQESIEAMLLEEGEEESVPAWMTEEQTPEPLGDIEFDPLAALDAADDVQAFESPTEDAEPSAEGWNTEEPAVMGDGLPIDDEEPVTVSDSDLWGVTDEEVAAMRDSEMFAEAEVTPDDYSTAFEDAPEAAEIAPAPNAPDWLNAMVPGLDIDYEASEDEPLETAFETPSHDDGELEPAMPEDFGWVTEIVDEEMRPQPVLEGTTARAPRFVFSRPPVWLRRLLERGSEQPSGEDDDLPAWLR